MPAVIPIKANGSKLAKPKRVDHRSPLDMAKGREICWPLVSPVFEASRPLEGARFVYFVGEGADGPVKIGTATNPIQRLRSMQTGNSRHLMIERILIGDHSVEKLLHEIWRDWRLTGEWFKAEVREHLYPVVHAAAQRQIDLFDKPAPRRDGRKWVIHVDDLCEEVKAAHGDCGVTMTVEARSLLLAQGAGYITRGGIERI